MKCCIHYHSMGIIKIYFGKSQEKPEKTFLAGLLNYNRKGYPQQTFFYGWPYSKNLKISIWETKKHATCKKIEQGFP